MIFKTENSEVTFQKSFLSEKESLDYFEYFLNNIEWVNDEAMIYGKKIITKRKISWYADSDFNYNYSGIRRIAKKWDEELLKIKAKLEKSTGVSFNSCLLNLYHDGKEGMAWHSDDQNHLESKSPVAIVSLGAERFFKLRETDNKDNQYKILLERGSLLLMLEETQKFWQHEVPKMAKIKDSRISLTWRLMKNK